MLVNVLAVVGLVIVVVCLGHLAGWWITGLCVGVLLQLVSWMLWRSARSKTAG